MKIPVYNRPAPTKVIQSALLAGVVAAVHSWPSFDRSPWPAKTLFGASFILSLMSVRKAKQLNYILRRLAIDGSETEAGDKIRIQLAKKNSKGEWIASRGRQMIWNGSDLFLNFSIITMVLGYGWMILGAAVQVSWDWGEDDTKVRSFSKSRHPPLFTKTQLTSRASIDSSCLAHCWHPCFHALVYRRADDILSVQVSPRSKLDYCHSSDTLSSQTSIDHR